ncbi:LacI family DNA-binding transcriptional regulator [Rhizobium sp. PAMB 3174]
MDKIPTVKDVAVEAGVSVGTVSRVLAGEAAVKPALRDKVNEAISTLGYRPNVMARALRTSKTDVIGLIVPDITNPFFGQMAASAEIAASEHKHSLMLGSSHNDHAAERSHMLAFLDRSVRGIIVVAASDSPASRLKSSVPIISLDRRFGSYPLVSTNHAQAAALVADHLFELGHRRIAYISGPVDTEAGRARRDGFVNRINALGDTIDLEIFYGKFDYESGEAVARKLLSRPAGKRPTAIAAASDQQAIGALRAARDLGIDIPRELSVTGFDDIHLANLVVPRLTTVHQPTDELARRAVELLFEAHPHPADEAMSATLVVRGSTGPPVAYRN